MKIGYIAAFVAVTSLFIAGCEQTDSGLHLGQFKGQCIDAKGKLSLVGNDPNEWKCELPDGTVTFSKNK